jgi:hypothetical protein
LAANQRVTGQQAYLFYLKVRDEYDFKSSDKHQPVMGMLGSYLGLP